MIGFFVVVIIIAILVALGFGIIGMIRGGKDGSDRMFKSLATRVSLSLALFLFVMFAGYMGWIEPNSAVLDAPVQK
ncbi:hypothetical protein SPONN_1888 [uncultured Candidatus Thioglobus sp.]|nr:hypothetical protein SPONL_1208 [uncultured Candidatus Thioglobus sp.]SMM98260.1 hypothetical protein SPONN_1888 [uncultured Candidatus Thioglobus sp.]